MAVHMVRDLQDELATGPIRTRGPLPRGPVARHTAAAEVLAAAGRWEEAYRHLRAAVHLLNRHPTAAELDRLRREHAEAREQSRRDSLTATYNRRYLDERLGALLDEPGRSGGVSLALVDVDHFKLINDTHGHLLGDHVLRRLVGLLDAGLPAGGFCARYGGEEFALVLPGDDPAAAVAVCEAVRDRVARHPWQQLAAGLRVTVSVGVVHATGPVTEPEPLIASADALLYAAKDAGRNVVTFRDAVTGTVRLAEPAGGRWTVRPFDGVPTPACDRTGSAP